VVLDQGVFSTLDNQVDPTTGTVKAKARFPNARETLFPSQFVNIRIALQTLKDVVVVPVTAVRTGPQGDFVWILRPDKTVTKRGVTRGPGTPTMTSITQGLRPGERVITEGGDRLTEGGKVTLPTDRPSPMIACMADMKKLCDGKTGREAFMCLREKQAQASAPCKASMAAAAAARTNGGGAGGGDSASGYGGAGGGGGGYGSGAGGAGGGGYPSSPEVQAARDAMHKACDAETKKLCPGQEGREASACLRENKDKASAACKASMDKVRAAMSASMGGGQGGGSPQPGAAPRSAPGGGAPGGASPPPAVSAGGGGGGGFTPSPEMAAAFAEIRKACAPDSAKLCPGLEGRESMMCLRQNDDKLSAACKAARAKMPRRPPAGE